MNIKQWKTLTNQRRKEIAAAWNIEKNEGGEIAEAVLREFIEKYGSDKSFQINDKIVRGNLEWIIFVRYLDDAILPKNFMGIAIGGYHIGHIDDKESFEYVSPELWGMPWLQQSHDSRCVGFLASYKSQTIAHLDFYTPNRNNHPSSN